MQALSRPILGLILILFLGLMPSKATFAEVAQDNPSTTIAQEQATLEPIAEGFTSPLFLAEPPDESGRLFVVDQIGLVHILTSDGTLLEEPFLDLRDAIVSLNESFDERGLLGFAFHPEFAENGRFYVSYSAPLREGGPANWNYTRRISEFTLSDAEANLADPDTERVLLEVDWPSRKHNGGALAFGPDGYLYIGLGDSGGAHGVGEEVLYDAYEMPETSDFWDTFAQDVDSLYGSILRIDVDSGYPGYAIPQSNPFVGKPGRDEIYAWGFRNPYRLTFDSSGRHEMYVTAVAETLWESIYLVNQPGNYGWAIKEGTNCFDRQSPYDPPSSCPTVDDNGYPILDPIIQYPNMSIEREEAQVEGEGLGTAVTGGYLYRGSDFSDLYGRFVFADFSRESLVASGQIFVATPPQEWGALWNIEPLHELDARILSMGEDADGELYVMTSDEFGPTGNTGAVYKLVPSDP